MAEPSTGQPHVTIDGDLSGDYVVVEQHEDGRLLLEPDTSVKAILKRQGARAATAAEFEEQFGDLEPDSEG